MNVYVLYTTYINTHILYIYIIYIYIYILHTPHCTTEIRIFKILYKLKGHLEISPSWHLGIQVVALSFTHFKLPLELQVSSIYCIF